MIIIILLFISAVLAAPALTSTKKYYKESLRMFDDTYTVGMWDLRFNESLYGYQPFGSSQCFNNMSCRSNNLACDPCDWTNELICDGTLRNATSPCPCGMPPLVCFPAKWPNDNVHWPSSDTSIVTEMKRGIIDIAYHPRPPNNCSCIIFKVDVLDGAIEGLQLHFAEAWYGSDGTDYIISRFGSATVCPSYSRWGQSHVVRIIGSAKIPYAKVRISVEYRDLPTIIHSPTCISNLPDTHQCLAANMYTKIAPLPGYSYIRLVIDPIVRCGVLGFWASSTEHLVSTNPWVSPENSTNVQLTHRESFPDNRLWPSIYPYCLQPTEKLYVFVLSKSSTEFFVDTAKEWMLLRPFTDFAPPDFFKRFLGTVTVNCPRNNYTAHRTSYTVSETMDTGSANIRMVYPSDDLDIFNPPPFFASEPYKFIKNIPTLSLDPNRIVVSVILNQRLGGRMQPLVWKQPLFQSTYEWLTIDEWNNCTLTINGAITNAQGDAIRLTIDTIDDGLPDCDFDLYTAKSHEIDNIQNETSNLASQLSTAPADVYRLWFLQDRIAATDAFYACKLEIQSYYTTSSITASTITNECVAAFGTAEFDNDECCNGGNCILQSRNISNQYEINKYGDKIKNCPISQCAQVSLTNLVTQLNLDKDPQACTNSVDRPVDENIYWKCVNATLGRNPVAFAGVDCVHDSECPNSKCNVYSGKCLIKIEDAEFAIISCIYNNLTQFTRTFVSNELSLTADDLNIESLWLKAFSQILPCSDPYTPVGFDMDWGIFANCQGCNGYIINTTSPLSLWVYSPGPSFPNYGYDCYAPASSQCTAVALKFSANAYCAVKGCNRIPYKSRGYFPFVSSPAFCPNDTFCGITDDNFFYVDVSDSIPVSACNNITLCILANGTRVITNSELECQNIYSYIPGSCSDATDSDVGIWTGNYETKTAGCFFDIRYKAPFNPSVSVCEPPFRSTIIGCSTYDINQSSCTSGSFAWGDPTIFELNNPRWITRASTKNECDSYGNVCMNEPRTAALPSYTNTRSLGCTNKLFSWTSGRLLPGQPRVANRVVGKLSQRFQNIPRVGLNFPNILANITKAVNKLQSLKVQSNAFCRNIYKKSLDELVCSCLDHQNDTTCYIDKLNISNIGVACDEESIISAADFQLRLSKTSLPPATCNNLFISDSSIITYQTRDITPLRTLLVNYAEDTEFAVRNKRFGIYGKVLTNGYAINFNTRITNITLCIKLSVFRKEWQNTKYPILDLAKRGAETTPDDLIPLNINVTYDSELFCADVAVLEPNQFYYFIHRMDKNYDTVDRVVFNSGEIAYISVLLTLYCFGLITATVKLLYLCYVSWENIPVRLAAVLLLMSCFFLFRVVLFSLLLDQSLLGLTATRAVNYLLFEFPILLYFAFVTNYICIWFTSIMLMKDLIPNHQHSIKIANYVSIGLNIFIFFMFIIIIILFETIIFEPYFICGGSILLFDSSTSFTLLLTYRIIFSSIAIILGCLLLVVAMRFGHHLADPAFNIRRSARMKLYALSIIGGAGLIGQAIYFLVITATLSTPVNYASLSILLVLEIIPALLFVFVESIRRSVGMNSSNRSTKSKTSKSSKSFY